MALLARTLAERGHSILVASRDRLDRTGDLDAEWDFAWLPGAYESVAVLALIRREQVSMAVADLPRYEPLTLAAWRAETGLMVVDEAQTLPLPADLLLNPQITWHDLPMDEGQKILGGPAYYLLPEDTLRQAEQPCSGRNAAPLVIVLGERDPKDLTSRVVRWLSAAPDCGPATLLLAPSYRHHDVLEDLLAASPETIHIVPYTNRKAAALAAHRAAVSAVGPTLYELAALGIPTLCLAENADEERTARRMEQAGALIVVTTAKAEGGRFVSALETILYDAASRARMAAAGRALVDGRGAERLAAALEGWLEERRQAAA